MNFSKSVFKFPTASHRRVLLLCFIFGITSYYFPAYTYAQGEIVVGVEDLHSKKKFSSDHVLPITYQVHQQRRHQVQNVSISQPTNGSYYSRTQRRSYSEPVNSSQTGINWWTSFISWYRSFRF